MSELPILSTGAVQQYPYVCAVVGITRTLQLADGTEQRFVLVPPAKVWSINLRLLQENERIAFLKFTQDAMRSQEVFPFTDPQDGRTYPTCRVAVEPVADVIDGIARTGIQFLIAEVRP